MRRLFAYSILLVSTALALAFLLNPAAFHSIVATNAIRSTLRFLAETEQEGRLALFLMAMLPGWIVGTLLTNAPVAANPQKPQQIACQVK